MIAKKIFGISFCLFILACNNKTETDEFSADKLMSDTATSTVEISAEVMEGIILSIPSPVEMSSVIKASGAEYNSKILNSTDNVDKYTTNYKKAFNMGIYGGDLGYINIYEKTYSALNYLSVIKKLADDLKVGQFFDFEMLKRLATNSQNIDSVLYISTSGFNNMDKYLREKKRGNLSVLIVAGAWMEGLYVATQVVKQKNSQEIIDRIGEQKIVLDNLLLIVSAYKSDPYFASLLKDFEDIKKEFDKVSITYEYHEPESKEVNGQLVIVDNSKTIVNITDKNVKDITATVERVRIKNTN